MNKDYTDITFIIDKSGSMHNIADDVRGGFNSFIDEQKDGPGIAKLSLIQFDNQYELNYTAKDIKEVDNLNDRTYKVRGSTALFDAIGRTIITTGQRLKSMKEEDRPGKVIFIIQTDGEENSSREFTLNKVEEMIKHQEEKYSWEFVFVGSKLKNVHKYASSMGFKSDYTLDAADNKWGMKAAYRSISKNMTDVRFGTKADMAYTDADRLAQFNAKGSSI